MADPAIVIDQNILPVQALFNIDNTFNTFIGQGQPFIVSATNTLGIQDVTNLNATLYPTLSPVSSGNVTVLDVTSTKLSFNPSSGTLTATNFAGFLSGTANYSNNLNNGVAGNIVYQSGANTTSFVSNGSSGQVLTSAGSGTPYWSNPAASVAISDDTTTATTRYPLFAAVTTGNASTEYVSSTKLQYVPSTGVLTATGFSGSGASLTSLTAGNLSGTIPSAVLGNSTVYIGTTAVALNRSSASISLTGTNIDGSAGSASTATTATNATNVAVTDNTSSTATWYPSILSNSTGNLPITVSSTKLQFQPSSGVLTATGFSGSGASLTGTATSLTAGKVQYALTAGTNITFSSGTTYDGSAAITINASGGGGMVYPSAGIPNSTGSAWGISYGTSGANSVALRDANQNISANAFFAGFTSVAASGTQITLTAASTPVYYITGSGGQVIQLPNATTLPKGPIFSFNNNQSSGAITVNNNSGSLIVSVPSGGFTVVVLVDNSTAAGTWDRHDLTPSNVSWSTNTFDYPGSITSATWNGNVVAYNRGGTGQSAAFVAGGIVYGSTTSALAVTSIGTSGQVLTSAGAGTPTWTTPTTGTVTSVGGTGTVNGLTLTGTVTSSGNLTLGGTLDLSSPPAIGGTSASTGRFTTVTSTVATGTAPFTVASTTPVTNLSIGGNAATATNVAYSGLTGTVPTWNQNTTGSAATLTTARAIYGNNFDGSAALTQIIASTYGGTGNGFTKFSGPTTAERTFTLPDATATILTSNAAVTIAQGGTGSTTLAGASIATYTGTETLTNKRIDPRVTSAASASSLTPSIATADVYAYTALAAGLTINAPTGTPVDGDKLIFRLLDNGTARALTWDATYTVIGVTLPTTTTASKTTYVGCIYNANNTRWDVIAVGTQA